MSRANYASHLANVPQSEPLRGKPQVQNAAGGYVFPVDHWVQLRRFLILGTQGGSYYVGERELTTKNVDALEKCIAEDPARTVREIVDVSARGLAPKNDPALFALAVCGAHGFAALPDVARTGTHLFTYVDYLCKLRGTGRGFRNALKRWYTGKEIGKLAYQLVKYQSREGWSHRDVLRLAHVKPPSAEYDALLRWSVGKDVNADALPPLVQSFERAKTLSGDALCAEIRAHRLTHEMIPTEAKTDPTVWGAMLATMPLEAMVRNLGNMTKIGLLKPHGDATREVVRRLTDPVGVRESKVHPFKLLIAAVTYRAGRGFRGKGEWQVVGEIDSALDDAFALAFENVPPTGKRYMLALDFSGSMWGAQCAGSPQISAAEAASAMCAIVARSEKMPTVYGFGASDAPIRGSLTTANYHQNLGIRQLAGNWQKDTLASLQAGIRGQNFGPTDCALPMLHAAEHKLAVDCFVVFTDSESWKGDVHASEALKRYRASSGIPARLVVCAMSATSYSIADPSDAGMMDIVGLDASVPELVAAFARGDV